MPKLNARHLTCTISNILLNHATRTYSTHWKQNTFLMKQHLKVYNNGSTCGSWSLQVAFNRQSTAELTTCMTFVDTLCKYYPAIVVLRRMSVDPSFLWKQLLEWKFLCVCVCVCLCVYRLFADINQHDQLRKFFSFTGTAVNTKSLENSEGIRTLPPFNYVSFMTKTKMHPRKRDRTCLIKNSL